MDSFLACRGCVSREHGAFLHWWWFGRVGWREEMKENAWTAPGVRGDVRLSGVLGAALKWLFLSRAGAVIHPVAQIRAVNTGRDHRGTERPVRAVVFPGQAAGAAPTPSCTGAALELRAGQRPAGPRAAVAPGQPCTQGSPHSARRHSGCCFSPPAASGLPHPPRSLGLPTPSALPVPHHANVGGRGDISARFLWVPRGRSGLLFVWSSTEQSLGAEASEGADDFSFLLFFTQEVRGAQGGSRSRSI